MIRRVFFYIPEVVTNLSKMPIEIIATIENSLKHGLEVLVAAKDIVVKLIYYHLKK